MKRCMVLGAAVVLGCGRVPAEVEDDRSLPAMEPQTEARGGFGHDETTMRESRLLREGEAERKVAALTDRLELVPSANTSLRAILEEHARARLEIEDYLLRTRGVPTPERRKNLLSGRSVPVETLEKARPAYVMSRIRAELGEEVLARYVSVTGDGQDRSEVRAP